MTRGVGCTATAAVLVAAEPDRATFNRDIRPIMSDTCFRCHGPDRNARQADMRLDIREEATRPTRSGRIPIVPGDPDKSEIIERVFADGATVMPPRAAHKELTQAQKDTIRRWVAEGAVYEGHWTYQPVTSGGSRGRGPVAHREPDRSLHPGSAAPRRADAGASG